MDSVWHVHWQDVFKKNSWFLPSHSVNDNTSNCAVYCIAPSPVHNHTIARQDINVLRSCFFDSFTLPCSVTFSYWIDSHFCYDNEGMHNCSMHTPRYTWLPGVQISGGGGSDTLQLYKIAGSRSTFYWKLWKAGPIIRSRVIEQMEELDELY